MIRAVIVGDPNRVPQYILRKFPEIQGACKASMARLVIELTRKIKEEKLSGQVLKTGKKGGHLRRSITAHPPESTGTIITGRVGTNVEYASIHEFGGKTPAHDIFPKRGRALAFRASWGPGRGKEGKVVFAHVHHPGSVFPERSFMRTALNEMKPEILAEFEKAIMEVIRR
jgi:phage gpG-like protein